MYIVYTLPLMSYVYVSPWHVTPASFVCPQLWIITSPWLLQSTNLCSVPAHSMSSKNIGCRSPGPKFTSIFAPVPKNNVMLFESYEAPIKHNYCWCELVAGETLLLLYSKVDVCYIGTNDTHGIIYILYKWHNIIQHVIRYLLVDI